MRGRTHLDRDYIEFIEFTHVRNQAVLEAREPLSLRVQGVRGIRETGDSGFIEFGCSEDL